MGVKTIKLSGISGIFFQWKKVAFRDVMNTDYAENILQETYNLMLKFIYN